MESIFLFRVSLHRQSADDGFLSTGVVLAIVPARLCFWVGDDAAHRLGRVGDVWVESESKHELRRRVRLGDHIHVKRRGDHSHQGRSSRMGIHNCLVAVGGVGVESNPKPDRS